MLYLLIFEMSLNSQEKSFCEASLLVITFQDFHISLILLVLTIESLNQSGQIADNVRVETNTSNHPTDT